MARVNDESYSFICHRHVYPQWKESSCLYSVSIHQMAPPPTEITDMWLQLTTHLSTP